MGAGGDMSARDRQRAWPSCLAAGPVVEHQRLLTEQRVDGRLEK